MTFCAGDLIRLEQRYAAHKRTGHPVKLVSPHDTRNPSRLTMISGSRFLNNHSYAPTYAEFLAGYSGRFVLIELGVLLGVGLAVWCQVFPKARVIGLDIDTDNFNIGLMAQRGAFLKNLPEVYAFDKLAPNFEAGEPIDVVIDDALHSDESILKALEFFKPRMAKDFLYFIEDSATAAKLVAEAHPDLEVIERGKMTVCRPRS